MPAINPQSRRSQSLLQEAFLDLLQEKPVNKIRISEVCQLAGIARPTFYSHFQTKELLLKSCIDDFWADLLNDFFNEALSVGLEKFTPQSEHKLFELWSKKFKQWSTCKEAENLEGHFFVSFRDYLRKFHELYHAAHDHPDTLPNQALSDHMINFFAGGLIAMLFNWSRTGETPSPEIMAMLRHSLFNVKIIETVASDLNQHFV